MNSFAVVDLTMTVRERKATYDDKWSASQAGSKLG
jgi:hypothetical protein